LKLWQKKFGNRYQASITINHKRAYLGTFDTPEEASEAYQKKLKEVIEKQPTPKKSQEFL
jgi:hypothetical protein